MITIIILILTAIIVAPAITMWTIRDARRRQEREMFYAHLRATGVKFYI